MDQNNQTPSPINPVPTPEVKPAEAPAVSSENTPLPVTPEQTLPSTPELSEAVKAPETQPNVEVDHISPVLAPADPAPMVPPVTPSDDDGTAVAPIEPEAVNEEPLNKKYFEAVDNVINVLKEKPFEEEEKAEDLTIGYVKERFGKELKKSDDE
jgi:hypothetical protein